MSDLICKYELFDGQRTWSCVGDEFAIHTWIRDSASKSGGYYGGLEIHYREAPAYMADQAPSHTDCWLLKAPCWHDGTSLYASEVIIPFWQIEPDNNERMFEFLRREYHSRAMREGERE